VDDNVDDKDFAEIKIALANINSLTGRQLWVKADAGLNLYSDKKKTALPAPADGWYKWTLGTAPNPPETIWAEGTAVGSPVVYARLVKSGATEAEDTVKISVEKMVWPNQDPAVNTDMTKTTDTWNGFELAEGWYHSSSLCQILNGTKGYIRTEYPQETATGRWQGTSAQNSNAELNLAKLCDTENWDDDTTVRIEVAYEFEQSPHITTGQYVDTNYAKCKEGFFHNGGVKIENRSEIQIYDTASLLAAINNGHQGIINGNSVTISADPANDINQTAKVLLQHTGSAAGDWLAENVNALITGIPYELEPAPQNPMAALNNAPTGAHTMTIDVYRQSGNKKYNFTVKIDNGAPTTYSDIIRGKDSETKPNLLYLQSHWGSGIKITSAKVKKL